MQYTDFFSGEKIENFIGKILISFYGTPSGWVVKNANISLSHLIDHVIISPLCLVWVGAPHRTQSCETSQVLLAGVPGGFSRGSPVFAPPTDWPVSWDESNEYTQRMLWIKKKEKKIRYTPANPFFFFFCIYIKMGFKGVYISYSCFPDEQQ